MKEIKQGVLTEHEVHRVVRKREKSMALAIILEYGTQIFLIPECEEGVKVNFRAARERALKQLGVLDVQGMVVTGHEEHAARWGFLQEEAENVSV